jgi:hypothetical protein
MAEERLPARVDWGGGLYFDNHGRIYPQLLPETRRPHKADPIAHLVRVHPFRTRSATLSIGISSVLRWGHRMNYLRWSGACVEALGRSVLLIRLRVFCGADLRMGSATASIIGVGLTARAAGKTSSGPAQVKPAGVMLGVIRAYQPRKDMSERASHADARSVVAAKCARSPV